MRARLAALLHLPLLLLPPSGARPSGIEAARLCCGNDCVDLAEAYPEAWARRDQLGKHAQVFPRVRSIQTAPLRLVYHRLVTVLCDSTYVQTYEWAAPPAITRAKERLRAGTEVRHADRRTGKVVNDNRPGGNRVEVEWTGHMDYEVADTTTENIDPRGGKLLVLAAAPVGGALDFGVGGEPERIGRGLGSCSTGLTLRLCPVEQQAQKNQPQTELVMWREEEDQHNHDGEEQFPFEDSAGTASCRAGYRVFKLGFPERVATTEPRRYGRYLQGHGRIMYDVSSRNVGSEDRGTQVLRIAVDETITVSQLGGDNLVQIGDYAQLPVVHRREDGSINGREDRAMVRDSPGQRRERTTPWYLAVEAEVAMGWTPGSDRKARKKSFHHLWGTEALGQLTEGRDFIRLVTRSGVDDQPSVQEWVSARTLNLRVEARTRSTKDEEDLALLAAIPALETNTTEFADAVDVPELVHQWRQAVDAAPSRGDRRTQILSFLAPFLSREQFQLASGAGKSSHTAALQWSRDHNVSPVKRSGYALDPERHPSWWVSNRPRGIGGDPGFTEEQVHTRNRICASGARSYEDIIEEFVEKIVSRLSHPDPTYFNPPAVDRRTGKKKKPTLRQERHILREMPSELCARYDRMAAATPDCRMSVSTCEHLFTPVSGRLSNYVYDSKQTCMCDICHDRQQVRSRSCAARERCASTQIDLVLACVWLAGSNRARTGGQTWR